MDFNEASITCAQEGSSSTTTKKKQLGKIKLVPSSVVINTPELRMIVPILHPP